MSEDWAEKSEAPTPHRRAEARRKGDVPRSAELTAAALSLGAILLLQHYGPGVGGALKTLMVEGLSASGTLTSGRLAHLLAVSVGPVLVGLLLIGVVAHLVQVGFLFRFKANAIDPAKGLGRLLSARSIGQVALAMAKLTVVGAVAYAAARGRIAELVALQSRPFAELASAGAGLMLAVALRVAAALLVVGLIDYAWQWLRHERSLRMTRREVKDEMRRLEGDPQTKRRRREVAARAADARLQRDVAAADVIIAGRTVAVGVKFDPVTMRAPRVVARACGAAAETVRETATRTQIPIVEREALARSLYRAVAQHGQVPDRLFNAVAEVLAYSYEVNGGGALA